MDDEDQVITPTEGEPVPPTPVEASTDAPPSPAPQAPTGYEGLEPRYWGKSPAEIAAMHLEATQTLTRQAQELAELKKGQAPPPPAPPPPPPEPEPTRQDLVEAAYRKTVLARFADISELECPEVELTDQGELLGYDPTNAVHVDAWRKAMRKAQREVPDIEQRVDAALMVKRMETMHRAIEAHQARQTIESTQFVEGVSGKEVSEKLLAEGVDITVLAEGMHTGALNRLGQLIAKEILYDRARAAAGGAPITVTRVPPTVTQTPAHGGAPSTITATTRSTPAYEHLSRKYGNRISQGELDSMYTQLQSEGFITTDGRMSG